MREKFVGLLAVVFVCVCGLAQSAPIVYTVDIADALTGTITTDGTIGVLQASDIVAWDLTLSPTFGSLQFDSSAPGSEVTCGSLSGCAIASPEALEFESGSSLAFSYLFTSPFPPFPTTCVQTLEFADTGVTTFSGGPEGCPTGGGGVVARLDAPYTIGAVPEPGTITLLGLALAGVGFARKRSREQQSTAV
jgi:hypothetical protein